MAVLLSHLTYLDLQLEKKLDKQSVVINNYDVTDVSLHLLSVLSSEADANELECSRNKVLRWIGDSSGFGSIQDINEVKN